LTDIFNGINIKDILGAITDYIPYNNPVDLIRAFIDIGIVSYLVYKLIKLVRETRAWQLLKGILVILIFNELSNVFELRTIHYILAKILDLAWIAIIVLFAPELRRVLEQIGRSKVKDFFNFEVSSTTVQTSVTIEEIIKAVTEMSKSFTGALIVIERETKIGEIINTGIQLDSSITSELLINIFTPNTPLHDGAVVLRENKIKSATCFLPLTDNPNLSKELGTRHRAALGITEVSDCIAVIVSEETGKISFALNGGLTRSLTPDLLRKALYKNLLEKNAPNKKLSLWKVKSK
jgi:diadenylate cyclase